MLKRTISLRHARMSIPKMSIPIMSFPIMSTVPKCLLPKNVYSFGKSIQNFTLFFLDFFQCYLRIENEVMI